jgi:hypothetical protein
MRVGEIIGDFAHDARVFEHAGEVVGAWLGPALKLAEHDEAVVEVLDHAGRDAVQTDEAQAAEDLRGRKKFRECLLVAEAVLQGEHGGVRADERREQSGKFTVGRGLERDDHQIANADLLRRAGGVGGGR